MWSGIAPDGSLLWQKAWGTSGFENGQGIEVGPDGNVYVAGVATRPRGLFEFDVVLLNVDPAGTFVWQRAYSASETVDARGGLTVGSDGSIYVAGTLQESARGVVDALVAKFAPDGRLVWDHRWGGRSGDTGEGVALLPDGTVVLSGNTNSYGAGSDDAFVLLLSASGRGRDVVTWGGVGIDHGDDVDVFSDGTIALGATAENPPYVLLEAPRKLSRLRGTVTSSANPLVDLNGVVSDAGGVVSTPAGSTTYAGATDAALVRIAP